MTMYIEFKFNAMYHTHKMQPTYNRRPQLDTPNVDTTDTPIQL